MSYVLRIEDGNKIFLFNLVKIFLGVIAGPGGGDPAR